MSDSFRIKVDLNNKSFGIGQDSTTGMGATVIPSLRGPMTPVKINRGETEKIKMLFGADRYEVLEAIAYNTKYPLWISAPYSEGVSGALLLTDMGLLPISINAEEGLDSFKELIDYKFYLGSGEANSFGCSIPTSILPTDFQSVPLQGGVVIGNKTFPIQLPWNIAETDQLISEQIAYDTKIINISGYTVNDNLVINIDCSENILNEIPVFFTLKVNLSKLASPVYAIIGMKFPCSDYMAVATYKADIKDRLVVDVRHKKKNTYYQLNGYPVEISLTPGTLNGNGTNIYAAELLKDDNFIFILPNTKVKMDWDVWDGSTEPVNFQGGFRGLKAEGDILVEGWQQFKEFKKYPADIYFDTTADSLVPAVLAELREFIPYRRFLFPLSMELKANEIDSNLPTRPANRGLCCFWGAGLIINPYESTGNMWSTLMGEVAAKYADARVLSFGGRAVAWGDENGVGGQLNQGRIIKFKYNATEDEMRNLDKNRVNPIIMNELFGPIIASRRTTDKSDTDYSYADYSMVIDYCVERILNEVLPYQLIKFNDDSHRAIVRMKTEMILKPLVQPPNNVIRDYAIKCDSENNNDFVLQQEKFILSVAVKVTPKAEFITFLFTNSAQGGNVEEDVK